MGYITFAHSQKEVVDSIILDLDKSENYDLVAKSKYGTQLWLVIHDKQNDLKFLTLCKLAKIDNLYGYKQIDEVCHPYYYDCPLKLLKLTNHGENAKWRELVINKHMNKKG